jgi:mycothiol synthase
MKIQLPDGYTTRPASMADAERVVDLFNAESYQVSGQKKYDVEGQVTEWQTPGFDLNTSTLLAISPQGEIAGYYEFWDSTPFVNKYLWGRVHPRHAGCGIGTALLAWAEEKASQRIELAPEGTRVASLSYVPAMNSIAQSLLETADFRSIRRALTMVIDLDGSPAAAEWPQGIQLRTAVMGQDERQIYHAVRDSFKDHWGYVDRPFEEAFERWLHFWKNESSFDPSLWFLAMDGDEIAGFNLCLSSLPERPEQGWVGTLGVRREWRRRGLGKALLLHSFGEFHRLGRTSVGLGVDAESLTGATRLYEKAGMHSDSQREIIVYEKVLRQGVDISTQSLSEQ